MAKSWMVGTIDDEPLQIVVLNGTTYFVDHSKGEVFLDEAGLPRVTEPTVVAAVITASSEDGAVS